MKLIARIISFITLIKFIISLNLKSSSRNFLIKEKSLKTSIRSKDNMPLEINAPPFVIWDCNNTLTFNAESLQDLTLLENYIDREPANFTMTKTQVSKTDKDGNTTVIDVTKLSSLPSLLEGSGSCINWNAKPKISNGDNIKFSMCLNSTTDVEQILESFRNFQICRLGGDLRPVDETKIDKLVMSTCSSIPPNGSDRNDKISGRTDKDGIPLPRVNTTLVKDFMRIELTKNGFIVKDNNEAQNGFVALESNNGREYSYEGVGADGKKKIKIVPGTPIPEHFAKLDINYKDVIGNL